MGEQSEDNWALGIETSNPSAGPSLGDGHDGASGVAAARLTEAGDLGPVEIEPLAPTGRHDDDLIPAIDRLTARMGLQATELRRTCVSIGPGGFTGLRVAVTTAKMLCEVTGAEVVAVPSAQVAVHPLRNSDLPALVCLASKRGTAHVTVFGTSSHSPLELGVIDEDSFFAALRDHAVRTVVADHHLPEGWAVASGTLNRRAPAFCAGACLRLGMSFPSVDALSLVPAYPREPEAVTRWKSRSVGR